MHSCNVYNDLCNKHLDLVLSYNKYINLTSITNKEEAKILHIEDSLTALKEINNLNNNEIADIGSGAGYPGIPLAIYTQKNTTICEKSIKKCKILKSITNELNLNKIIDVFNGRAEELALKKPNFYSIVTARALAPLPSLIELASPLLKIDGMFIAYKSINYIDEIKMADKSLNICGMQLYKSKNFKLSDGSPRSLLFFKKISKPKIKLPRKLGFAQKKPLIN